MRKVSAAGILLCGIWSFLHAQDTLTLRQVMELTLANNFDILIARNDASIASNNNTLGASGFLPVLNAGADLTQNVSNTHQELFNGTVREGTNARSGSVNPELLLNWTLFDGTGMFIRKEKLEELEKTGEIRTRAVVEQSLSEAMVSYYSILQQQKVLEVIGGALAVSRERLSVISKSVGIGKASELSRLQALADLNADSMEYLKQTDILNSLKVGLNRILSRDPSTPFVIGGTISTDSGLSLQKILDDFGRQSPALLSARQDLKIAGLNLREAKAFQYPSLDFFAGYSYTHSTSDVGLIMNSTVYGHNYGLTLSMPLFDGHLKQQAVKNSRIELESAGLRLEQSELGYRADIIALFGNYASALDMVSLERQNLDVTRKNLDVSFEKYRLGMMSDIDFRISQQKYLEAENALLLAQLQAKVTEIQLQALSGNLLKTTGR
jgi:outer membrane protein TolC